MLRWSLEGMNNWAVIASWVYLAAALLGLVLPMIWNRLKQRGSFLSEDEADEFEWLSEEERKRLNVHLNREKYLWDYWRSRIDYLVIVQCYCVSSSVVAPILIAALAPLAKEPPAGPHVSSLLSLISIHLAVTTGLYKAFRVENTLQSALKLESDFYALFYRFQEVPSEFGKTSQEQTDEFLKRYDKIRKRAYDEEIRALPTGQQDGGKKPI